MSESAPGTDATPRRRGIPFMKQAINGVTALALAFGLSGDRGLHAKATGIEATGGTATWYEPGEGPKVVLPVPDQYRLLSKQPFTEQFIPSVMELFNQAVNASRDTGRFVAVEHWQDAYHGDSLTYGYVSAFRGKPAGFNILGHAHSDIANSDFFRALGADPGQVALLKAAWIPKRDGRILMLVGSGALVGNLSDMACVDSPCLLPSALEPSFRAQLEGMKDMYEVEIVAPRP